MKWLRNTRSLCPVCIKPIDAYIYEKDNKIIMHKECEEHGKFDVLIWSDAALYHRFMKYSYVG
ncbi:MAG: radical SAM protein, partial [Candidatus Parvarchaeota archaeon]|nr:radical SAM protein [Candidatus Jingweiarchaeum tengchongense]